MFSTRLNIVISEAPADTKFFKFMNNNHQHIANMSTKVPCEIGTAICLSLHCNYKWRNNQLQALLTYVGVLWCICLQGVLAAPQSCILCDKNDLKTSPHAKEPAYEEFLFEHQVSRHEAIDALLALNDSYFNGVVTDHICKSVSCTKKVMKYCIGPQFINDHCWCELGRNEEGLPFVPHICYVGEKMYTASVGSCFFYEEVKECCCAPVLANQWRHISAGPSINRAGFGHYINSLLIVTLIYYIANIF